MSMDNAWHIYRSMTRDRNAIDRRVSRALVARILTYARPYRAIVIATRKP